MREKYCKNCNHYLLKVSADATGSIEVKCRKCKTVNVIQPAGSIKPKA